MRTTLYYSTYAENLRMYLKKENTEAENEVFWMLWGAYFVDHLLTSAYFELLRIGDGRYTIVVQKCVNGTYSVKYTINDNYANKLERYT